MKTLDPNLVLAKNRLSDTEPWLLLVELILTGYDMLYYDTQTQDFGEGYTITGVASGATADILFIFEDPGGASGLIIVTNRSTVNFQNNEALTDEGGGAALVNLPLPTGECHIRLAKNVDNVTYEGYTWTASNMVLQAFSRKKDAIPQVSLNFGNADGTIEKYVRGFGGMVGQEVRLLYVYNGDLTADPALDDSLEILKTVISTENRVVTLTLGMKSLLSQRFPKRWLSRKGCAWQFGSTECGYSPGVGETCKRNLKDCLSYSNQGRFGGFPAIPGAGFDA